MYLFHLQKNTYKYLDQDVKQDLGMEIDVMTFDWIASISSTGEIPQPSHTTGDLFCI